MTTADDLRQFGLDVSGDPPTVSVPLGDMRVRVQVRESDRVVGLSAEVAIRSIPPPGAVDSAALGYPGDTAFSVALRALVGSRHLIQPSPAVLYDALFELAKATNSVARQFAEMAELDDVFRTSTEETQGDAAAFYAVVTEERQLLSGGSSSRPIGTLRPGGRYRGLRIEGGWAEVEDDAGSTGWIPVENIRMEKSPGATTGSVAQ